MTNPEIFATLMVFGAALRAETIVGRNVEWDLGRNKIFGDQEELNDDYESLLTELAKNRSKNYGIDVVLSRKGCPICDRILVVLMEASRQSFLTIDSISSDNHSSIVQDGAVPDGGYYKFVLFLTKNVLEFFQHFTDLRSHFAWNPRARHLIFAAEKPADEELEMIFEECWSHKVLNVAVITKNDRKAFTYNPYLENQRRKKEEVDWSRLFYDKLRNMNEFPIRIKYIPYSSNSVKKWIQEGHRLRFYGLDFGYAEAFCKSLNATPQYVNLTTETIDLYRDFPYRYGLWTERRFTGVDLWMNAMPIHTRFQERSEQSYPLYRSNLGILVPKSGHKAPSIFEPYQDVTWTCLVVSLMTFALYSNVFYKLRGINDNAFLRTFGIFLGKNLANRRLEFLEKFTFMTFTMFSLLIVSAYQGALYSALTTVTYYPEIETMAELYEQIKTIHAFQLVAEFLRDYVNSSIEVVAFGSGEYIDYMETHPDDAYAFPEDTAKFDAQRKVLSRNGAPLFHVMKEDAMPGFNAIISPYGSPYLEKLDEVLLACREAGLNEHWEAESRFYALLLGTIIMPDGADGRTPRKLSLQTQIIGFYIWGTGLMAGCLCCAAEILFHKYEQKTIPEMRNDADL